MQKRRGDQNLLAHPFGVRGHRGVLVFRQPEDVQERRNLVLQPRLRQGSQPTEQREIFRTREVRIQVRFLGHIADARPVLERLLARIDAIEEHLSSRRLEQTGQNRHGRRLP